MKPSRFSPALPLRSQPRRPKQVFVPVPHPFHFGFRERRPLVPMSAVKALLHLNSRAVVDLIDEGRLRWAFDIRSREAAQREVRVLWQSLLEFSGLYPPPAASNRSEEAEFQEVIELILPPGTTMMPEIDLQKRTPPVREPALTGAQVAACFACLSQHVANLAAEQSLQALNLRQGPKASRWITRASAVKFLKERRIS